MTRAANLTLLCCYRRTRLLDKYSRIERLREGFFRSAAFPVQSDRTVAAVAFTKVNGKAPEPRQIAAERFPCTGYASCGLPLLLFCGAGIAALRSARIAAFLGGAGVAAFFGFAGVAAGKLNRGIEARCRCRKRNAARSQGRDAQGDYSFLHHSVLLSTIIARPVFPLRI